MGIGADSAAQRFDDGLLDRLSRQGDPEADAVIADHMASLDRAEPREVFASIGKAIAAMSAIPTSVATPTAATDGPLVAYLAATPALPAWVDDASMREAADVFADNALLIGTALFCASLPEAYAAPRGARVLTLTARLVTDPVRRIGETAQMVYDVMSPSGLVPRHGAFVGDGPGCGWSDARRVRIMHGAVRWFITHDSSVTHSAAEPQPGIVESTWFDAWGAPLNQEDLLGTLMTFTISVFEALERMGAPLTVRQREAYLHRWCVVGHLLGIQPDLLPVDLSSAEALTASIRRRQQRPTADGELLAGHLITPLRASVPLPPLRGMIPALIRHLITPPTAAKVGVHANGWSAIVDGPFSVVNGLITRILRRSERHNPAIRWFARHASRHLIGAFLGANRGAGRPSFAIPDELRPRIEGQIPRKWRL